VALGIATITRGTDGPTSAPTDAQPVANTRDLRLKNALMPLLQYVREGQPRDALKQLSDPSGATVDPAGMSALRRDALVAVANIEHLDDTATTKRARHSVSAATALYAEAAGLAEDASRDGDGARRSALAVLGGRVLQYADALFDQARRTDAQRVTDVSAIRLDPPQPVPDIGPESAGTVPDALVPAQRRSAVGRARKCLRRRPESGAQDCPAGPVLAMTAASALRQEGARSEQATSDELAFRIWAEAEQLRDVLAHRGTAPADQDRPRRLRELARMILETSGGR
jgi:hypothetical protein